MAPAPTPPAVQLTDILFDWPGRVRFSLRIDRFTVAQGEKVLLLGSSGSGKSTLLSLICGIAVPQRGRVDVGGAPLNTLSAPARDRFRADRIGVIFQMFNLLPYATPLENILLPLSFARARRPAGRRWPGDAPSGWRTIW